MASQASEVWLHPVGGLSVGGIGGMRPYQRELFENLKINFHNYSEGIVELEMRGACSGCPSSMATLKMGVENMLKHYIPEIMEVREVE